jgi:uncharacterized protein YciW
MSVSATSDVMDSLADLESDSPLCLLRRERPDVVHHTQGIEAALFHPSSDGGLSPVARAAAAFRIAELLRDPVLIAHYKARLAAMPGKNPDPANSRRMAILAHVERLTLDPDSARRIHLDELSAAGLTPQAIVALSELVAYVNYQVRVLAGLRMLKGAQ